MIRTFGCSLTYGHGLKDCKSPGMEKNPKPSIYAWPKVIEEISGKTVENWSRYGSSVKYAAFVATNKINWKENDCAIFLWPTKFRTSIIQSISSITDVGHWNEDRQSKTLLNLLQASPIDSDFQAIFSAIGTDLILKEQGVKCFHLCNNMNLDPGSSSATTLKSRLHSLINVIDKEDQNFNIMSIAYRTKDYGYDGQHPGLQTHRAFGKLVYRKIKDNL